MSNYSFIAMTSPTLIIRITYNNSNYQITEICRSVKLPLSDAVIDRMLEHCETHGDGQYV